MDFHSLPGFATGIILPVLVHLHCKQPMPGSIFSPPSVWTKLLAMVVDMLQQASDVSWHAGQGNRHNTAELRGLAA